MEVAIYFNNGATAYFKEIEKFNVTDEKIFFDYYGVSSQKNKKANFNREHIAGYSYSDGY